MSLRYKVRTSHAQHQRSNNYIYNIAGWAQAVERVASNWKVHSSKPCSGYNDNFFQEYLFLNYSLTDKYAMACHLFGKIRVAYLTPDFIFIIKLPHTSFKACK